MSTQQIRKRIEKVERKAFPEHGQSFTWEEFSHLCELWRQDKEEFRERAKRPEGSAYRAFVARFGRGRTADI